MRPNDARHMSKRRHSNRRMRPNGDMHESRHSWKQKVDDRIRQQNEIHGNRNVKYNLRNINNSWN